MNKSNDPNLRRVIVDFKKLTPELLSLVVEKYPDGYGDDDIITFRNANYELIEAIEIIHKDTKYLVKISAKLEKVMLDYEVDQQDDVLESNDKDVLDSIEANLKEEEKGFEDD